MQFPREAAGSAVVAQLFSVREYAAEHGWDATIARLREVGFGHVEPFLVAETADELRPSLARHQVAVPTCHGWIDDDRLAPTLDAAASLGAKLVMQPIFRAPRWATPDEVARIADDLNRAAEAAAPYGMRVAFHNHDDEVRIEHDGRPAIVTLMDQLAPTAGVQFDPNWAAIAGVDVLDVLSALGPHVFSLHLKDGPGAGANTDQVALGDGTLPWPEIIDAAPDAVLVIAPDMFAGDSMDAVIRSRAWLERTGRLSG